MSIVTALVPAALDVALTAGARELVETADAENTKRAQAADWKSFTRWCLANTVDALPATPQTVCNYIDAKRTAGLKPKSVSRHLSTITSKHLEAGVVSPCADVNVRKALKSFRKHAAAAPRQAEAMTVDVLRRVLPRGNDIRSLRDRALLLCGFFMAGRRSEIVAITVEALRRVPGGIHIYIATSKTDQEGNGAFGVLPRRGDDVCPVGALDTWLEMASISSGPVFRGINGNAVGAEALCDKQVNRILQARVTEAGLDATKFSAHSLRRGFATSCYIADPARHVAICRAGRWSDNSRAFYGYIQEVEAFRDAIGSRI